MTNILQKYKFFIVSVCVLAFIGYFATSFLLNKSSTALPSLTVTEYVKTKMVDCETDHFMHHDMDTLKNATPANERNCLDKISEDILSKYTLKEALVGIEKNSNTSWLATDCHDFAHAIGKAGYGKYKDFTKSITGCTSYCNYGCFHAVAEEYFKDKYKTIMNAEISLSTNSPEIDIKNVCKMNGPDYPHKDLCYRNLFHGLGHAFMAISGNNVNKSLRLCDFSVFKNNQLNPAESCYFGVFMINSQYSDNNDILSPCNTIDGKYQAACYSDKTGSIFTGDIVKNIDICKSFPIELQEQCFSRISVKHSISIRDITILKKDCDLIPIAKYRGGCVKDIVRNIVNRFGTDYKLSIDYCYILDAEYKKDCYGEVYNYMDWLHDETNKKVACDYMKDDKKYISWCTN